MGGGFLMFHGKRGRTPLIGPVGGLIQLHGSSSVEVTKPARTSRVVALSGRVTEQRGPAGRREWAVGVGSAYPEHFHALRQLESGITWTPPFWWFDESAQVTNMLTPAQSMLADGAFSGGFVGGAGEMADGTPFLRSIVGMPTETVHLLADMEDRQMAVPFNTPLTASVYATAFSGTSGSVTLEEIDPQGDVVAFHVETVPAGTVRERVVIQVTTTGRTVAVRARTYGLNMTALPAITLTDSPQLWADGRGCATASFEVLSESVNKAVAHPTGRRFGYNMTVHELG